MNTVNNPAMQMAKESIDYCVRKSCGKCVSCRIGGKRLSEIFTRMEAGQEFPWDRMTLERLCRYMASTSACGTGRTAGEMVLKMIRLAPVDQNEQGECNI